MQAQFKTLKVEAETEEQEAIFMHTMLSQGFCQHFCLKIYIYLYLTVINNIHIFISLKMLPR